MKWYHGTSAKNARKITQTGRTFPEFWLSAYKKLARDYAKTHKHGRILSFEIERDSLVGNDDRCMQAINGLYKDNGIWKVQIAAETWLLPNSHKVHAYGSIPYSATKI